MSDIDLIRGWLICGSTDHWKYPKRVCQECIEAEEARAALARVEEEMAAKDAEVARLRGMIDRVFQAERDDRERFHFSLPGDSCLYIMLAGIEEALAVSDGGTER